MGNLAILQALAGHEEAARTSYLRAIESARDLGDLRWEAVGHANLALLLQEHGAFAEAPGSQVPVGGMPPCSQGGGHRGRARDAAAECAAQSTGARRPLANERETHQGGGVAAIAWWDGVR